MTAASEEFNRYGFVVDRNANKIQIKGAVEEAYGVTVDSGGNIAGMQLLSDSNTGSSISFNSDVFTINVNGSGDTETESADLDVREDQALSLFGAYNGSGGSYYQRSSGGVCKECYLYAGDPVANIPALATSINSHYSIY